MSEFEELLAETHRTHESMQTAVREAAESTSHDIVALRTRYAQLLTRIMQTKHEEPALVGNPQLKTEFNERFRAMRELLTQHQQRWNGPAIKADPAGYAAAARRLTESQDGFYSWARSAIARGHAVT